MKYTETRTLSAYNLRKLCIEKNWYTHGSNREYNNLLHKCSCNLMAVEMTTDKLAEIAADIFQHSAAEDCKDGYLAEITEIMFELAAVCYTTFEEV